VIDLRRVSLALLAGLLALGTLAGLETLRRRRDAAQGPSARESILLRQNQELVTLINAAEEGTLLDFEGLLVVVDQSLVQDLLRATTPLEGDVGGGFHVRIDSASAAFRDGLALVSLEGRVNIANAPVAADLVVYGAIDLVELDATSGVLRGDVAVFGIELQQADVLGVDEPARKLTEALTKGGLAMLLRTIEIPVRIENRLAIPAVESKRLKIGAAELPLRARVASVRAFGGKLWVFVDVDADPSQPAKDAKARS
jgi:hypothetical protein